MDARTEKNYRPSFYLSLTFGLIVTAISLIIYLIFPTSNQTQAIEENTNVSVIEETEEEITASFKEYFAEASLDILNEEVDKSLNLYRNTLSRSAVEWFYFQITGDKDVTQAILTEADNNDIPLSLAFSLAHAESGYNVNAINKNSNTTTDRGLFQLNSNTFQNLTEADFFDPYVSAKYGMSHLRFCINTAGNEVSALAMYNAGTGRVRSNRTPQVTLNYIGKIISYQKMLEELFNKQVADFYDTQLHPAIAVAYTKDINY